MLLRLGILIPVEKVPYDAIMIELFELLTSSLTFSLSSALVPPCT
jgi:hypothetical protein